MAVRYPISSSVYAFDSLSLYEKGIPLPKFGEWDVNDPASAEGFTVIFNKARNEKKTGGKPDSPTKDDSTYKPRQGEGEVLGKAQSVSSSLNTAVLKVLLAL
ncbi:hypothetical protein FNV43_RR14970 [Rhamnella rubrinervis]|uniref:RIN4 pathogenic type III effector avirulence factor Avr cleavage site domain-containing protein n=1 Tax=Rhamnella rubrinervis TaxID=2594499 RepID=A0A8K0H4C0_9ROSA|nr:hypothetical protein FNV43_RR14970 [Rhamnella rubrinervis]